MLKVGGLDYIVFVESFNEVIEMHRIARCATQLSNLLQMDQPD